MTAAEMALVALAWVEGVGSLVNMLVAGTITKLLDVRRRRK